LLYHYKTVIKVPCRNVRGTREQRFQTLFEDNFTKDNLQKKRWRIF
jgi:hypothetical protein